MMTALRIAALALCACLCTALGADDFKVRLGLKHGHLRELYVGCAEKAGPGYDRDLDDFAPPHGIQTGYTVLLPAVPNLPAFYKDIRGFADTVTWKLQAQVYGTKTIEVTWDGSALPAEYDFTIRKGKQRVNMREQARIECEKSAVLTITATRRAPKKEEDSGNLKAPAKDPEKARP